MRVDRAENGRCEVSGEHKTLNFHLVFTTNTMNIVNALAWHRLLRIYTFS